MKGPIKGGMSRAYQGGIFRARQEHIKGISRAFKGISREAYHGHIKGGISREAYQGHIKGTSEHIKGISRAYQGQASGLAREQAKGQAKRQVWGRARGQPASFLRQPARAHNCDDVGPGPSCEMAKTFYGEGGGHQLPPEKNGHHGQPAPGATFT